MKKKQSRCARHGLRTCTHPGHREGAGWQACFHMNLNITLSNGGSSKRECRWCGCLSSRECTVECTTALQFITLRSRGAAGLCCRTARVYSPPRRACRLMLPTTSTKPGGATANSVPSSQFKLCSQLSDGNSHEAGHGVAAVELATSAPITAGELAEWRRLFDGGDCTLTHT